MKSKIVSLIACILLSNNSSYSLDQEQSTAPASTPKTMCLLKPTPKPKPENTGFQFNNEDLDRETKRNVDEFNDSLKETFKTILESNRPVLVEHLKLMISDPELRETAKKLAKEILQDKELVETGSNSAAIFLNTVLKNPELMQNSRIFINGLLSDPQNVNIVKNILKESLRDPQVASAARYFIENANKSLFSTKNLFILLWVIPAVKATKDLAPYIVKYLSRQNPEKIKFNNIINNKHSKLLALAMAGIASSGVQAFIAEKTFYCAKWTAKEIACLISYLLK